MSSATEWTVKGPADALRQVSEFFEEILAEVSRWVPALAGLFEDPADPPRAKMVNAVTYPLVARLVGDRRWPVVGAGFVAAEHVLADTVGHMAWWQGEAIEPLVLLSGSSDAYMRREWFTKPMEQGQPHVTGPYVDFLCTDEYTVTMTVPVTAEGRRVGVVGADVFVESLEPHLIPALRALHPAAALINHAGRVVISADAQLAAGTLLAPGVVKAPGQFDGAGKIPRLAEAETPRTVRPRGDWYAGAELLVLPCGRLPLAIVHPAALGTVHHGLIETLDERDKDDWDPDLANSSRFPGVFVSPQILSPALGVAAAVRGEG